MLLIDTVAAVLVVYFSWKNDTLPASTPETGPFRIKPLRPPPEPVTVRPVTRRRSSLR